MMSLKDVLKYESEMEKENVSRVARGKGGFLTAYKDGKLNDEWKKKRNGFIARHLAQYIKNPTYRRRLALNAWAYNP